MKTVTSKTPIALVVGFAIAAAANATTFADINSQLESGNYTAENVVGQLLPHLTTSENATINGNGNSLDLSGSGNVVVGRYEQDPNVEATLTFTKLTTVTLDGTAQNDSNYGVRVYNGSTINFGTGENDKLSELNIRDGLASAGTIHVYAGKTNVYEGTTGIDTIAGNITFHDTKTEGQSITAGSLTNYWGGVSGTLTVEAGDINQAII